jgi:hypothetical protein
MSIPSEPYRFTLISRCSYCPPLRSGLSRLIRMDPVRWVRFITRCGVRNVARSWCIWRELVGLLYDICIYRLRLGVRRLFAPCAEILNTFYCLCLAAPLKYRCFPFLSFPIRLASITEPFPEGDSCSSPTPELILILLRSKWNVSMVLFVGVLGLTTLRIHEYLS